MDCASMLRCMVVALTPEQEHACRMAIVPVEVVSHKDVREACAAMSTVLPLVVVVDEGMSETDQSALKEFTTACGAEMVAIDHTAGKGIAASLLEALRVAERRRLGMRT
jgi:hypothetical protein